MIYSLFFLLLAFVLAVWLTRYLYQMPHDHWLSCVNHANERSLHVHPTAGSGGLAILSSFFLMSLLLYGLGYFQDISQSFLMYFYAAGFLLASVSFIDDQKDISPLWRLLTHFLVAYLVLIPSELYLSPLRLPTFEGINIIWLQQGLYILFVVWMINLYNFMDGMDGFAGGMSVFGFSTLAIAGLLAQHDAFALINALLVVSSLGFLVFNFPPAKIFMGDVGASTLGYFAAALILWANHSDILPLWAGLLAFSPFIVDATVTLFIRISRKEKIWQAHKTHHYQQLVEAGWSHKKTVLHSYGLMAACGVSALCLPWFSTVIQWAALLAWIIVYVVLMLSIRNKFAQR